MPVPTAKRLHMGVVYNPEHWPESRWPEDIRLMTAARVSVVRMGEFAWAALEPAEGAYDFDWLERAINLLADAGILTVIDTPSAAPPAWLTQHNPDTLAVDDYGRRAQQGNRCPCCVNAPAYHSYVRSIVAGLARRFGPNPHVIGWQIGHECDRVCYCDQCRSQFHKFLQERYETLDALNERWATRFCSQTYSDWAQIPLPIGPHNPGLLLEFKRFQTHSHRRFLRLQIDALRPHLAAEVWITHNFTGWPGDLDQDALAADLDVTSWDWTIDSGQHDHLTTAAAHDLTRGFKQQNFWGVEAQPGAIRRPGGHNALDKGEARAMAWQAAAHGAEAVFFGQWRPAPGGQGQYHGGLLDQSGQPRPLYAEVRQLGEDFAAASPLLIGSNAQARAAILHDYESRWSIAAQPHHPDFDYTRHLLHYYRPLAAANVSVDIIPPQADLDPYRLVIAPALIIVDDELCERLKTYVKRGGYLILTARTGMKDRHNALLAQRPPGPLAELAGIDVEEYYALDSPIAVKGNDVTGQAHIWAERLHIFDDKLTQVMARYGPGNGWLDQQPAITVHPFGRRGMVYYVGAYLDDAAQAAFMALTMRICNLKSPLPVPAGVEVSERIAGDGRKFWIIINHTRGEQRIQSTSFVHDQLTGISGAGNLRLPPYGVRVLCAETRPRAPIPLSLPRVDSASD